MKAEVTGTVTDIMDARVIKNGSKFRDFIVEEFDPEAKTPNILKFQIAYNPKFHKYDNTVVLDNIPVGSKVRFTFKIAGRTWDGDRGVQHYIDLKVCSKIDILERGNGVASSQDDGNGDVGVAVIDDSGSGDMPF